ncbi:MAG: hypothetical protein U1E11_11770 [Dethiobacteria bacterium]|nr:hypothetical protein [Dethiobacteria bacterium]
MIRAKQLNWIYIMLVFVLVAMLMVAGCGGSGDEAPAATDTGGETGEEPAAEAPAIEGTLHETERVSMIIADGWDVMDIQGGLQAYKGNSAVEVSVRGSGMNDDAALQSIEKFKTDYEGTDVMELEAHGMTFYTTTFTFSGMLQTKMSAMKDGEQYSITMAGADHLENDVFTGMVNSIEFK